MGEMLHHCGLWKECVSERCDATQHGRREMRKMLHHWMQHTMEAGPLSKEKSCCISVGYERNVLANVASLNATHQRRTHFWNERNVALLDAKHDKGRPTFEGEEMMHHCGIQKACISERCDATQHRGRRWERCCITGCNARRRRAHFRRRRDVASLDATHRRPTYFWDERDIASLDATHEEGGPEEEEMLHHWMQHMKKAGLKEKRCCITGKWKECTGIMSAELLSHGCNRVRVMQQMATNCLQEEDWGGPWILRKRCISIVLPDGRRIEDPLPQYSSGPIATEFFCDTMVQKICRFFSYHHK